MTERSTSEIVASLRRTVAYSALEKDRYLEAADRLAEQLMEIAKLRADVSALRRDPDERRRDEYPTSTPMDGQVPT